MTFEELGLLPELLKAVAEAGYTEPTPIQAQAIPVVLEGKDVMGGAQTGTGKTAGFVLPLLQRLARHASNSPSPARHPVRALILTPTRELAMQVHESVQTYGKYVPLRDLVVYGGVDIKPQTEALRRGVEIVVATPGRLLDHVEQKSVGFNFVEVLVLDEADRMLDMGFIPDIKRILALLPKERQSLLFSATFSEEIKKLADSMLRAPVLIEVARRNALTDTVTHRIHPVAQDDKRALLAHLLKRSNASQVLVFVGTKFGASRLAHYLEKQGINATAIHGDKSQQQRTEALEAFKNGTVRVLVATDVAARGLDIDDLPHVINYELPHVPEDYVHRIGRTGRAGKEGDATSLVCAEERGKLAEIEKLIKRQIEQVVIEGYEPEPSFYGAIEKGRRGRGGRKDEPRQEKESRREPREKRERRELREPRRVEPAKPKYPKLDFDPSKPYEPKVSSGETAAPEPKRSHHRPKRPVPALLGGLPKPEPEK
ncbi:MAG: DEAD/DEAH box helicase [Zoogloeaceae bacterium]|nr:DEAD/DEAH box helicase [Zoogloeaceae bacterium]MCK6383845.1 DEAD/DEAH box helicase [Rhodocyclaceae bacterium]